MDPHRPTCEPQSQAALCAGRSSRRRIQYRACIQFARFYHPHNDIQLGQASINTYIAIYSLPELLTIYIYFLASVTEVVGSYTPLQPLILIIRGHILLAIWSNLVTDYEIPPVFRGFHGIVCHCNRFLDLLIYLPVHALYRGVTKEASDVQWCDT